MRVTMSMLYTGLKTCVLCQKGIAYNKQLYVDDVCFSKKSKLPTDISYVLIDWSDYDQQAYVHSSPEMLILATRHEQVDRDTLPPCALVVYSATSLSQLFEICRDVMRYYFQWGDELLSLIMKNRDLQELVSCAHQLLKNPIMILDSSMKVLAFTPDDTMDDAIWKLTVEKGYADLDGQSSLVLKRGLALLNDHDSAYNHPMHGDSWASAKNVVVNGNQVALVSLIQKNHPISEGDFACLCYFGDMLALYFKTRDNLSYLTDNRLESIITDLLDERFKNEAELNARIRNVNWLPKLNFFILTIQSCHLFLNKTQMKKISEAIVKMLSNAWAIIYDDHIVILINHNSPLSLNVQETSNLRYFLKQNQLCAGISNSEKKISEIARLYRQSLIAIEMGSYLDLADDLFLFSDHRVNSMLYAFIKLGDVESYLNPCIKQLQEYDTKKNAALLKTLIAYLKNNCKQLKTSQDLFIQRGTLIYRLKKIEELCQVNLSDDKLIFDLQLSLNLYLFMHAK